MAVDHLAGGLGLGDQVGDLGGEGLVAIEHPGDLAGQLL
jgi:hypothetical protein